MKFLWTRSAEGDAENAAKAFFRHEKIRAIERNALRLGSGGAGSHRGGDGVVRELRVLEPCRLSIISERRRHRPQGERGGEPGAAGANFLNGEPIGGKLTRDLSSGDVIRIETPGGGGFGR